MQEKLANDLLQRGRQNGTFHEFCDWLLNMLCQFKPVQTNEGYRVERVLKRVS